MGLADENGTIYEEVRKNFNEASKKWEHLKKKLEPHQHHE